MLAATYLSPGRIEAIDVPIPTLANSEAIVKVHACGICGSDISIVKGSHPRAKAPLVIGHEFAGEIVDLPSDYGQHGDRDLQIGDRVALFPLLTCGACFACRNGFSHVCQSLRLVGFDRDGGMAEYVRVPTAGLIKIPPHIDWESAALIEPVAVCVHAFRRAIVDKHHRVVVLGAGPIGLLMAMVLKAEGIAHVTISDINPYRLAIAASVGLAAINSMETDIREHVRMVTDGDGADIVFEAAGVQATADQMCQILRPRGTIVNVSVFKNPPNVDMRAVNFLELNIVGSRVYDRSDYSRALEIVALPGPRRTISHRFSLSKVGDAFKILFDEAAACKILILPESAE